MALKCIFLLGLSAYVSASTIPVAPVAEVSPVLARVEDFDAAPQYSFAYDVQDALTGDSKAQHETRNGDVVQGSYSLIEPDGTRRIVDYTADPINGFNAVVSREPATVAVAPVVAKAAIPAAPVAATPVIARVAAPVAPVAPVAAAPVIARTVVPAAPVATAPLVARAFPVPVGFPPVAKVSAPVAAAPAIARIAAPLTYAAAGYTI